MSRKTAPRTVVPAGGPPGVAVAVEAARTPRGAEAAEDGVAAEACLASPLLLLRCRARRRTTRGKRWSSWLVELSSAKLVFALEATWRSS